MKRDRFQDVLWAIAAILLVVLCVVWRHWYDNERIESIVDERMRKAGVPAGAVPR